MAGHAMGESMAQDKGGAREHVLYEALVVYVRRTMSLVDVKRSHSSTRRGLLTSCLG
jgi:hypothetical protein